MLTTSTEALFGTTIMRLVGVLDAGTHRQTRDVVIKAQDSAPILR